MTGPGTGGAVSAVESPPAPGESALGPNLGGTTGPLSLVNASAGCGTAVASDEALRIGLVTRVWPDPAFGAGWRAYAQELAAGPTEAYALTKEALRAGADRGLAEFLDAEAALQDRAGRTKDYAEGVDAFLEKRPARFSGS